MASVLESIVERTRQDLSARKRELPLTQLEKQLTRPAKPSFYQALHGGRARQKLRLIAECKKASPSKGVFLEDYQPVTLAKRYQHAGAAALSVLTEPHFFLGAPQHLSAVQAAVPLPVLRKDFVIDPYQIAEARAWGASAALLLVCLYNGAQLKELLDACTRYGVDALVEVHDEPECETALASPAMILGINNRNLKNFEVKLDQVTRLAARLSHFKGVLVAESGYQDPNELLPLRGQVDACLIGEGLYKNPALLAWFHED